MWEYNHMLPNELYHHGVLGMRWGVRKSKKQLAKSSQGIKMNLQLFAKRAKSRKTINLKPKEAAIIFSELRTNITKEQKKQSVITKAIGNYTYTFENHFDDTYRVIGRKKIPQSTTEILRRNNDEK